VNLDMVWYFIQLAPLGWYLLQFIKSYKWARCDPFSLWNWMMILSNSWWLGWVGVCSEVWFFIYTELLCLTYTRVRRRRRRRPPDKDRYLTGKMKRVMRTAKYKEQTAEYDRWKTLLDKHYGGLRARRENLERQRREAAERWKKKWEAEQNEKREMDEFFSEVRGANRVPFKLDQLDRRVLDIFVGALYGCEVDRDKDWYWSNSNVEVEVDVEEDDEGWESGPPEPFRLYQVNEKDLHEHVNRMNDPTNYASNFFGMTAEQHKANVKASLLRAKAGKAAHAHLWMFNEAKSTANLPRGSDADAYHERFLYTPAILDTGASYGLTPFIEDFITYQECEIKVKAVGSTNTVVGMGIVLYRVPAANGQVCYLPGIAYHLKETDIRLISPQAYHQQYQGRSEIDGRRFTIFLAQAVNGPHRHKIIVDIDKGTNLPMIFDVACHPEEKELVGPHFRTSLRFQQHFHGKFFGTWRTCFLDCEDDPFFEHAYEFDPTKHFLHDRMCPCVTSDANPNLDPAQKEVLLWHFRLQCSVSRVQQLMREHTYTDENGNSMVMPPVIQAKHPRAATCSLPPCATCNIARAKARRPKIAKAKRDKKEDKALTRDKYLPGDFVSMDMVPVGITGRSFKGYGRENSVETFRALAVFVDAASGVVKVYPLVGESTNDVILAKLKFEEFMWTTAAVTVKEYHADQGSVFTSAEFRNDCKKKAQKQSFAGTSAQFQNGSAERTIQTIFWSARSMMLHCSLRWASDDCSDAPLWPQAVCYAEWLFNRVPKKNGFSPLEILTRRRSDHKDLNRAKVWGCPTFVLDPTLAEGKKLPKFKARARVAQYMGMSDEHSTLVGLVRHLISGSISPQYHLVFDETFESVTGLGPSESETVEDFVSLLWEKLFDSNRSFYIDEEYDDETKETWYHVPTLDDEWLNEEEIREKEELMQDQIRRNQAARARYEREFRPVDPTPPCQKVRFKPDDEFVKPDDAVSLDDVDVQLEETSPLPSEGEFGEENDNDIYEGAEGSVDFDDGESEKWRRRLRPERSSWKGGSWRNRASAAVTVPEQRVNITHANWMKVLDFTPAQLASLTEKERAALRLPKLDSELSHLSLSLSNDRQKPVNVIRDANRTAYKALSNRQLNARLQEIAERDFRACKLEDVVPTLQDIVNSPLSQFIEFAANDSGYSGKTEELICQWVHPAFLSAKTGINKADYPSWEEAMRGDEAAEYWKAAELEIATLEKMKSWEVVDRPLYKRVLKSLWALRRKRLPSGEVRKHKARFTARGDMQQEGVDFDETWAPVVQWSTVRVMLILQCLLNLQSLSADVECAFLHSDIDSEVYVEMPKGFEKPGKVLKLKKSLYGLRQAPRLFWKYLTEKMEACGMKQSRLDPCLFVGPKVIAVAYVDDILFFAKEESDMEDLMESLRAKGLMLEKESTAAGFLGIDLKVTKTDSQGRATEMELTQTGLIDRIITNLGLDQKTDYGKFTPADAKPLTRDPDGPERIEDFNYAAVVGQLLYLSGHTRPEIAYATNQCARYMFCPKRSHELALKRIGKYLKLTRTKGIIVKPSGGLLHIDAFPDADFAGLYGYERPNDPACVKSRTGFVIRVANCPTLWKSTLQSKTALSTMEAEITALAACCKELFAIMNLTQMLADYFKLEPVDTTMNVTVHEDNSSALVLAKMIPPEFTPRSKFFHLETIWFREQIHQRNIKLVKVETKEQLGDIFTKGLTKVAFEYLRMKLCGW